MSPDVSRLRRSSSGDLDPTLMPGLSSGTPRALAFVLPRREVRLQEG